MSWKRWLAVSPPAGSVDRKPRARLQPAGLSGLARRRFFWRRAGPGFLDAEFFSTDSFAAGSFAVKSFAIKEIGHEPVHFIPHPAGGTTCGPVLRRFNEFGLPGRILHPFPVSVVHVDDFRKRHESAPPFLKNGPIPRAKRIQGIVISEDILLHYVKRCQWEK